MEMVLTSDTYTESVSGNVRVVSGIFIVRHEETSYRRIVVKPKELHTYRLSDHLIMIDTNEPENYFLLQGLNKPPRRKRGKQE